MIDLPFKNISGKRNIYILFAAEDGCINQINYLNKIHRKEYTELNTFTTNGFGAQHPYQGEREETVMKGVLGVEFPYEKCTKEVLDFFRHHFKDQGKYLWNFSKIIIEDNQITCFSPWEISDLL